MSNVSESNERNERSERRHRNEIKPEKTPAELYIKQCKIDARKLAAMKSALIRKVFANVPKGSSVLEIGCGVGDNYKQMTEMEFVIMSIENEDDMIRTARKLNPFGLFQKKDFCKSKLQSQSQYDVVFAQSFINKHPKADTSELLQKMLYIGKQKVYVSTTLHDTPSEYVIDKLLNPNPLMSNTAGNRNSSTDSKDAADAAGADTDVTGITGDSSITKDTIVEAKSVTSAIIETNAEQKMYASNFTRSEFLALTSEALLEVQKVMTDFRWITKTWDTSDVLGNTWIHFEYERFGVREMYLKQGLVVMNRFFSGLDVEKFLNEIESIRDKVPPKNNVFMKYYDSQDSSDENQLFDRMENVVANSEPLHTLINYGMHNLATWFTGTPVMFVHDKICFNLPGKSAGGMYQTADEGWSKYSPKHITLAICIDGSEKDKPLLSFVPGLHTKRELYSKDNYEWEKIPFEKGDVIVYDSFTPTKMAANDTGFACRMIFLTFLQVTPGIQRYNPITLSQESFGRRYIIESAIKTAARAEKEDAAKEARKAILANKRKNIAEEEPVVSTVTTQAAVAPAAPAAPAAPVTKKAKAPKEPTKPKAPKKTGAKLGISSQPTPTL